MNDSTPIRINRSVIFNLWVIIPCVAIIGFLVYRYYPVFFYTDSPTAKREIENLGGKAYTRKQVPEIVDKLGLKPYFGKDGFKQITALSCTSDEQLQYVIDNINLQNLVEIGIDCSRVRSVTLSRLKTLPKLTAIHINNAVEQTFEGLKPASRFPALVDVYMNGETVTSEFMNQLAELESIGSLSIKFNHYPEDFIKSIGRMKNLHRLSIPNYQYTDDDLHSLNNLTSLDSFFMDKGEISEAGIEAISNLSNLQQISLQTSPLSPESIKCLEKLNQLTSVSLSGSQLTDEAVDTLCSWQNLTSLALYDTRISDTGLSRLAGLPELKTLTLSGSRLQGEGFQHLSQLEGIRLRDMTLNSTVLAEISQMEKLSNLAINNSDVENGTLQQLINIPSLTRLELKETRFADTEITSVPVNSKIAQLYFFNISISADSMCQFQSLPELTSIYLDGKACTEATLLSLKDFPSWESIYLSDCAISAPVFKPLENHPTLESLSLSDVRLTEEACQSLPPVRSIRIHCDKLTEQELAPYLTMKVKFTIQIRNDSIPQSTIEKFQHLENCTVAE